MKILISAITGFRNRGVEALVRTTIEQISQRQPDATFGLMTETSDYDIARLGKTENIKLIDCSYQRRFKSNRFNRLRTKASNVYKPIGIDYGIVSSSLENASAVIASGGDMFSSDYGMSALQNNLRPLEIAIKANVPIIFAAQSIGPFTEDAHAEKWLTVARRTKLITVREEMSYKYLTQKLRLPSHLVKHVADPAFLLAPTNNGKDMLKNYGLDLSKPVIALAVSQGISRYASGCNYDQHLSTLKDLTLMLVNELQAQVLLVPHVQEVRTNNDDRVIASKLLRALNFNSNVKIAGLDHSASEFKALIGACDMVIAERMHAAIAGLSSGVCTVVVGYSVKGIGIMTDLLGTDMAKNNFVIPLDEFVKPESACEFIQKSWQNRQQSVNQLNTSLPKTKERAKESFDLIASIIH